MSIKHRVVINADENGRLITVQTRDMMGEVCDTPQAVVVRLVLPNVHVCLPPSCQGFVTSLIHSGGVHCGMTH
jgi:hypothetical protein